MLPFRGWPSSTSLNSQKAIILPGTRVTVLLHNETIHLNWIPWINCIYLRKSSSWSLLRSFWMIIFSMANFIWYHAFKSCFRKTVSSISHNFLNLHMLAILCMGVCPDTSWHGWESHEWKSSDNQISCYYEYWKLGIRNCMVFVYNVALRSCRHLKKMGQMPNQPLEGCLDSSLFLCACVWTLPLK